MQVLRNNAANVRRKLMHLKVRFLLSYIEVEYRQMYVFWYHSHKNFKELQKKLHLKLIYRKM